MTRFLICLLVFVAALNADIFGSSSAKKFKVVDALEASCEQGWVEYVTTTGKVYVGKGTSPCVWKETQAQDVTISTSGPVTMAAGGLYICNAAGGLTYNLPVITANTIGSTYTVRNYTGMAGAITVQLPAATTVSLNGNAGTAASTLVSTGLSADGVMLIATEVGKYIAFPLSGFWTAN